MSTRIRRAIVGTLGAVMVVALPACKDDPTGTSGDALSLVEATDIVSGIYDLLELIDIPLLSSGPAAVPYAELYDPMIDVSIVCDGEVGTATMGGTIAGDVDQEAGTADITVSATADFAGCQLIGDAVTLTLDGNPDIDFSGSIAITDVSVLLGIEVDGNVSFETDDGRSGTCDVTLSLSAGATALGVSEQLTGTICGVNAAGMDVTLFGI
jgi:hypothetical protein